MNMSKRNVAIMTAVLAATLITAAVAQQAAHMHHPHGDMGDFFGSPMMGLHQLDLTDQQKQQIKTIMQNEHPKIQPLMKDMGDFHKQIETAMDGGTLNQTEALALIEQHKNAFAQMLVEHANIHDQIMKVLTPEQQQKLKDLKAQHEAKMQQWMQKHQQNQGEAPSAPPQ
jgi:Spy/CpxP family protein refolding chaperone